MTAEDDIISVRVQSCYMKNKLILTSMKPNYLYSPNVNFSKVYLKFQLIRFGKIYRYSIYWAPVWLFWGS